MSLVEIPPGTEPGTAWVCENGQRHFQCPGCMGVYTVDNTDHDPAEEAQRILGEVPQEDDRLSVCDDCYPVLVERARAKGLIP